MSATSCKGQAVPWYLSWVWWLITDPQSCGGLRPTEKIVEVFYGPKYSLSTNQLQQNKETQQTLKKCITSPSQAPEMGSNSVSMSRHPSVWMYCLWIWESQRKHQVKASWWLISLGPELAQEPRIKGWYLQLRDWKEQLWGMPNKTCRICQWWRSDLDFETTVKICWMSSWLMEICKWFVSCF